MDKKLRLAINIIALIIFQSYIWFGVYPMYRYYPEYKNIAYGLAVISLIFTLAILISIYLILSEEDIERLKKFFSLKDVS